MHGTSFGLLVQTPRPDTVAQAPLPVAQAPALRSLRIYLQTFTARVLASIRH